MATGTCKNCGGLTNSTTSNYWFAKDNIPTECYAKWDDKNNGWVRGCSYDKADNFDKKFADSLIK